jgi:hypothetical protein
MKTKYYLILLFTSFLVGCSLEEDDSSEIQIGIDGNTDILRKSIKVEMKSSSWSKTLNGTEIGTLAAPNFSQSFDIPKSGNVEVKFILSDSTGVQLNSGSVSLAIKSDWRWTVTLSLSNHNPFYMCFGCIGYSSFAVDSVFKKLNGDSLFVVWGGNSIKHPVIY